MNRWNPKGAIVGQRVTMEVRAAAKGKPRSAPKGKPRKQTAAAGSSRSR